ncbi:MAG: DUF5009 domain-containing protein [Candidatus Neomarinimicrobiota bacterium]
MDISKRLTSLDAFRGLAIAGMILVNNPGSWSHVYAPLLHAKWHGWTPTDWIFPFFLFIMGVAIPLSMSKYHGDPAERRALWLRIFRRTAILFGLGLFLYGYPHFDWAEIRIPGVLQRIAVCYLAVSALVMLVPRPRDQWLVMGGLIALYLVIMWGLAVPEHGRGVLTPDGNAAAYVDRLLIGQAHLWGNRPYDPEGLVSTLPAILSTFLGLKFGRVLVNTKDQQQVLNIWFTWAAVLLVAGLVAGNQVIPVNKQLWTPSYALLMAGFAGFFLATCYWVIEVRKHRRWAAPFIYMGMNPLIIFWLSGFLVVNLALVKLDTAVGEKSLWTWIYLEGYLSWLPDYPASLAFALTNVLLWLLVGWVMFRRKWFIKV